MSGIRVVYFDYGNVLSFDQSSELRSEMLGLSGLEKEVFETRYSQFRRPYDAGLISAEEYWKRILDCPGGNNKGIENLIELDVKSWERIDERMIELVRRLKGRGFIVGILSNMPAVMDRYLKRYKEWYNLFHPKIISGHLRLLKPEPEIYAHAAAMAGHRPEEIIFIDDLEENVRAAAEAGFQVHRFEDVAPLVRRLHIELSGE